MSRLGDGRRKPVFRALSNLTTGGRPILTIRTNGAGGRGQSGVRRVQARNRQPTYIGRFDGIFSFSGRRHAVRRQDAHQVWRQDAHQVRRQDALKAGVA